MEIRYLDRVLQADDVNYNSKSGDVAVDGHVIIDGGPNDEHIEANRGTYNLRSEAGRFENVTGTTGIRLRGTRLTPTSSSPFYFTGKVVEKTGPDHYRVYDGTITTCELPHPKWEFNAHKVVVDVGGNAKIYRSTFRIKGVPILYFPFATHPVQRGSRGFLFRMSDVPAARARFWANRYFGPSIAVRMSLSAPSTSPAVDGPPKASFAFVPAIHHLST